jgi:hypothetical protein
VSNGSFFDLRLERDSYRAGEPVRGWVMAYGPVAAGASVAVVYREWTSDYSHEWLRLPSAPLAAGPLTPNQWYGFAVALPPSVVPGCASQWGGLGWFAEVQAPGMSPGASGSRPLNVEADGGADGVHAMLASLSAAWQRAGAQARA